MISTNRPSDLQPAPLPRWAEAAALLVILVAACVLRFYQIGTVPPGPHYDEAGLGLDALDVLAGQHSLYFLRSLGEEALSVYLTAPLVASLGPTLLALRLPMTLASLGAILGTFFLARELLWDENPRRAQYAALIAAGMMALSFWYLGMNRIAFRANYVPLFEVWSFFFFWRAVHRGRLWMYAASGAFLGLCLSTYIAGRFVPGVYLVLFGLVLLLPGAGSGRPFLTSRARQLALLAGTALVVAGPMLFYFLIHPEYFLWRASGVSLLNPVLNQGNPLALLIKSALGNLAQFGGPGDPHWLYNLAGRSALSPVEAALFWVGLAICLLNWRKPEQLFLPVWFGVMLLPAILAPDPIPHSLRAIGTAPAVFIAAALPLAVLLSPAPASRLPRFAPAALAVLVPLYFLLIGYGTFHSYFQDWANREEVYYAYYGQVDDLAAQMNRETDSSAVFIVPLNYDRKGQDYHEYGLELLHPAGVPFRYIVVDDATVAQDLNTITKAKRRVELVTWLRGDHIDSDPRQVLPFYLQRFGRLSREQEFRGYRIETYDLESSTVDFAAPFEFKPVQANSNELALTAVAAATAVPSGDPAWIALQWKAGESIKQDYQVSLRLIDDANHLVGQADSQLMSNAHTLTSRWASRDEVTTFHLVPTLAGTLPGRYQLQAIVYDRVTQAPLALRGTGRSSTEVTLGTVEIAPPRQPAELAPEARLDKPKTLAPNLMLTGLELDRTTAAPGDTLPVALYLKAVGTIEKDHSPVVRLIGQDGRVAAEARVAPSFGTSRWKTGDAWRLWVDLKLDPGAVNGEYTLAIGVAGGPQVKLDAERIQVEGRGHVFTVPAIQHAQAAQLGDSIEFLGYDLDSTSLRPGASVQLTLYWRAAGPSSVSYTVFTHLLDQGSVVRGQEDSIPGAGELPTPSWVKGEVIEDGYSLTVAQDAPPGPYVIEVGMYDAATGQRLRVQEEGQPTSDRLVLNIPLSVAAQ